MEGERLERFKLMGKTNRELEKILGKNLQLKKKVLVDMIMHKTRKVPGWGIFKP